ncbi:MAG TPA: HAMP domain-containing sensor histidine kinase [Sphingomicrobium sp.]|nr:HAMP domain-containing sensor histidine kinase [Sphingomicrobium sp.]
MAETVALPVRGTVDGTGLLVAADPPLARLQEEAGAALGSALAIPQLAALVRLARTLGVTLSRPALAGTAEAELDLWVRAEPVAGEVRLAIEQWVERPVRAGRWVGLDAMSERPADRDDFEFELDAELRIRRVGRELARQLGVGPDSLAGTPLTRLVQLEPSQDGALPLLTALAARRGFAGQAAALRSGGARLTLAAEPMVTLDGEFAGYQGTTDFGQEAPAVSIAASAEWDALLREPLDVIVTEAERISDRAEGPLRSDYAAYASDIAGAARHLLGVLQNMGQDMAEPEGENEPIDLAALASEAAGLVQPQAAEAGVTLELEGATNLPAMGQRRAVTQILVNLIGNAVRYSPRGSTVRIAAENGGAASVSVTDNGPGVAAKDRDRIFERFEQAQSRGEGAGLGLAISRRLARSMGGDIGLDSTPGKGARFTLTLPPR